MNPDFSNRRIEIQEDLQGTPAIWMPSPVMQKVFDGLVKNAVENTPDGGKVEIFLREEREGVELVVRDFGVGITAENQKRIFEGFFATQETIAYSSKRPFDFNAGGKGADLFRIKIFAERYDFKVHMDTIRCHFIPRDEDICPGRISECQFCHGKEDCLASGGTVFRVFFPERAIEGHLRPDDVSPQTVPGEEHI